MTLIATTATEQSAIEAIKAYSTARDTAALIDQDKAFNVAFSSNAQGLPGLPTDVRGWTYAGLYEDEGDPFAVITTTPDPTKLNDWANRLAFTEVSVWLNSAKIGTSDGGLVATALHEFELHVLPMYEFHLALLSAKSSAGKGDSTGAAKIIKDLANAVKSGTYSATSQHESAVLRANQVLATIALVSDKVSAKAGAGGLDIDETSFEYTVMMTTRNDAVGDSSDTLSRLKAVYDTKLDGLRTKYGAKVVNYVVEQFELD